MRPADCEAEKMADYEFHIDTSRLVISHLDYKQDSHCDFLIELDNSARTSGGTISAPVPDRASARQKIQSDDLIWTLGYGRYLVSLKSPCETSESGAITFSERAKKYTRIGVVTMKLRELEGAPSAPDVGYGLLPAFQGKGYATEAAAALIKWFEEEKGQSEFFGFCDPGNHGSKGVLRRLGFEERGVKDIKGLRSDGGVIKGAVFSKGISADLEEYGLH